MNFRRKISNVKAIDTSKLNRVGKISMKVKEK